MPTYDIGYMMENHKIEVAGEAKKWNPRSGMIQGMSVVPLVGLLWVRSEWKAFRAHWDKNLDHATL